MIDSSDIAKRAESLERSSFYEFFETIVECSEKLKKIKPGNRKAWLAEVIKELYDSQGGKCAICREHIPLGSHEVDHIIPFCYGGGSERSNIQLTCLPCNRKKSKSVEPNDLLRYLEDRYMNL